MDKVANCVRLSGKQTEAIFLMYIKYLNDLTLVLTAQTGNFDTYKSEIGGVAQDLTDIAEALANATALKSFIDSVTTDKTTALTLRDTWANGPVNSPLGAVPVFQVFAWPHPATAAGQIPIANQRNRRFKNSPTITEEAIAAMMLATEGSEPAPPTKPTGEAHAAASGYAFGVVVVNRQQSDRWRLNYRLASTDAWTMLDSPTGKTADAIYPGGIGDPVKLELQIQLLKNNQAYGPPSDTFYVTLNP